MQCPQCQAENKAGRKFCAACGQPLPLLCLQCGFPNDLGDRFCGGCGQPLMTAPQPTRQPVSPILSNSNSQAERVQPLTSPAEGREAERRQLTVMFCDLVGSTALSEQLDPEDLREVVRLYQEACATAISRFDGYIAQYLGDGLLVYFGYPIAYEDAAERAVRAGLGILTELHQLNARLRPTAAPTAELLQVRIGIHTGLVVIGEVGGGTKREQLALGETPNIAARVQGLAEPGTVVLSAATSRLIEGYFTCRNLGARTLKGISLPVSVYQVLGESEAHSRFEAAATKGLTPLVGREQEAGLLSDRWEQVKGGAGQVVLLRGEAGIGKSRLVQMMKEQVASEAAMRVEYRCSPYYQQSALYPVIDHLQRLLQFKREDSSEEKLRKLEEILEDYGFVVREVLPLFAALLSVPLLDRYAPLLITPQRQKQKTLEILLAWLLKEAERQPTLTVWEDLQWADPSTLEFLTLLFDQAPTVRLLVLLTSRPDFRPSWNTPPHMTQISLTRLARQQVETLIERVTGGKKLPPEVVQQVVTKTDGVPLFVEELTKTVLESRLLREGETHYELTGPLPPLAIPATLQDSLTARLDRLATVREVAQLGATLGREFSYELIAAVAPLEGTALQRELTRLVDAELLYQRGLPPQAHYIFKHAMIQDAAYQSLLRSKKQQYHQQIAQVLNERFPETSEPHPELIAHHYTEAGLKELAIVYWQKAGQRAIERSADVEAIGHLHKGLELLKALPDTEGRIQQELTLLTTLGPALMMTKGYAAQEVESVYAQAQALCQRGGTTPELFPALLGLATFHLTRGEFHRARELGNQLLDLAQQLQDSTLLVDAHYVLGTALFHSGELAAAREHLEQGIALYDLRQQRTFAIRHGQDPGVFCLCYMVRILWFLGYPDQARQRSDESLTLAHDLAHPFSLALALTFAALVSQLRQEWRTTQERAEAAIVLCSEQGFEFYLAMGTILRGWALTKQGLREEGIAELRQGLAAWCTTGAELFRPHLLALVAEAYGEAGQIEEGLTVLAEALAAAQKGGMRFYEAEVYRLKGQLTLQQFQVSGSKFQVTNPRPLTPDPLSEAETCFQQAIKIARRQGAKLWELRAATSLSCLWQAQGKKNEARHLLAEVYGWFTEGFDTADLQEAKTLLADIS